METNRRTVKSHGGLITLHSDDDVITLIQDTGTLEHAIEMSVVAAKDLIVALTSLVFEIEAAAECQSPPPILPPVTPTA